MERAYDFSLCFHGDVILNLRGECFNLGYNYTSRLPIIPWLYSVQVSGKNIFKDLSVTAERETLDRELEGLVNDALFLSRKLPVSLDDFNLELEILGIKDFCAGNNKTVYSWQLEEENILSLLQQGKTVIQLSQEESKRFVLDYLGFLNRKGVLSLPRNNVQGIIRRLGEI